MFFAPDSCIVYYYQLFLPIVLMRIMVQSQGVFNSHLLAFFGAGSCFPKTKIFFFEPQSVCLQQIISVTQ